MNEFPLWLRQVHFFNFLFITLLIRSAIKFVEDYDHIGQGEGGWRDDVLDYYLSDAGI